jgi:hypothetical protein
MSNNDPYNTARHILNSGHYEEINDKLITGLIQGINHERNNINTLLNILEIHGRNSPSQSILWLSLVYKNDVSPKKRIEDIIENLVDNTGSYSPEHGAFCSAHIINLFTPNTRLHKNARQKLKDFLTDIAINSSAEKASRVLEYCLGEIQIDELKADIAKQIYPALVNYKLRRMGLGL